MVFSQRNSAHEKLRREIYLDAKRHGYAIQPIGHEHLNSPIPPQYTDDTSWSIRATPDDLILYKRSTILEVKSKLENHKNISIELKPLEVYKKRIEEIFVGCETIKNSGLTSVKVQNAKEIPVELILIPDRQDNIGKHTELLTKYPTARILDKIKVNGGSGTPFVLIEPSVYTQWLTWVEFRTKIILERRHGQILLDEFMD